MSETLLVVLGEMVGISDIVGFLVYYYNVCCCMVFGCCFGSTGSSMVVDYSNDSDPVLTANLLLI